MCAPTGIPTRGSPQRRAVLLWPLTSVFDRGVPEMHDQVMTSDLDKTSRSEGDRARARAYYWDFWPSMVAYGLTPVSYTHLRAHETDSYLVCRLLLEKK